MGTTSGALAASVIDALVDQDVSFAVLHRAAELHDGKVESDIDLVVADPPLVLMRRLRSALGRLDLNTVMVWRYDAGQTLTFFLARSDLGEGVQLDLLCDPLGHGKYGIRTGVLLEETQRAEWPQLLPLPGKLYLLRKRIVKGQQDRVSQLVTELGAFSSEEIERSIDRLLVRKAAHSVRAALVGELTRSASATPWLARASRLGGRILNPTGAWVHGDRLAPEAAREIAGHLQRFIPRVEVGPARGRSWRLRHIEPLRRRPAVVISYGHVAPGTPDVTLSGSTGRLVAAEVSSGLADLTQRRWFGEERS